MDMRSLAKQLKTKEIKAHQVIFRTPEGEWVFENPKVIEANMMGNKVFQVFGNFKIKSALSEEDISLIVEKTGCSKEEAKKALKETGDIAEAILQLGEE